MVDLFAGATQTGTRFVSKGSTMAESHRGFRIERKAVVARIGSRSGDGYVFLVFNESTNQRLGREYPSLQAALDAIDAELGPPSNEQTAASRPRS
jgi:hypothetical protein